MNSPARTYQDRIVTQRSYSLPTTHLARLQQIESHLEAALKYVRAGSTSLAVGRACRAASLLKQLCAEALKEIEGGANVVR